MPHHIIRFSSLLSNTLRYTAGKPVLDLISLLVLSTITRAHAFVLYLFPVNGQKLLNEYSYRKVTYYYKLLWNYIYDN